MSDAPLHEAIAAGGGWKSRRLAMGALTMVFVLLAGVLAGVWPSLTAGLPVIVGALVATYTVYCGASAANGWTAASIVKAGAAPGAPDPPAESGKKDD